MNEVIISGLVKGDFQDASRDGVLFRIATSTGRNNSDPDVFLALSYGNAAQFLKQHAVSGNRVVAQGRISSEKLDTDNYHTVITVTRILAISEGHIGMDFTHAVVSGTVRCDEMKQTQRGTSLAGFNVKNVRHYKTREGVEGEYTTYMNATAWADTAERLQAEGRIPSNDEFAVISGILKPNSYEKDGDTVNKTDIWINDIVFSGEAPDVPEAEDEEEEASEADAPAGEYKSAEQPPF